MNQKRTLRRFTTFGPVADMLATLDEDGAFILLGALPKTALCQLHNEVECHFADADFCKGLFFGGGTKRVHSLVTKSAVCRDMIMHPLVLNVMQELLGPACDKIQLNLTQGIEIWPGEKAQILHRDDDMFPAKIHTFELMANAMWASTDFTADNGATVIVPGSHKWVDRERQPQSHEIIQAEMKAGEVLIYLGSVMHGGGENRSQHPRTGIAIGYCLGWLRQYENQYFAAPPQVAKNFPKELQDLLGYCVHRPNLGMYEGNEPNILLREATDARLQTRDWLTPVQDEAVKKYYDEIKNQSGIALDTHIQHE
jgi:ectoine hydroxylase-related dioxygenase (phytanoyl-CoA dioxygenase family)